MARRLSTELKQRILEYFERGMRSCSVARTLNLSVATVQKYECLYLAGYYLLSKKFGIRDSTIRRGVQNYLKYGIVNLPRGRNAVKKRQKYGGKETTPEQSTDESLVSKKELKDLHDEMTILRVLLEEYEKTEPDMLKKKEFRQHIDFLNRKLAIVKSALS